ALVSVGRLARLAVRIRVRAFVTDDDLEPWHEERRLTGPRHEFVVLERRVLREDLAVRPVAHTRAADALLDLAAGAQLAAVLERGEGRIGARLAGIRELTRFAAVKAHRVGLPRPVDLDVEPLTQRVDHRCADAVKAARCGVRS